MIGVGSAISCFECHSLDGSMRECEDVFAPYNVTGHLFRRDCVVGHLGFEAFYCIKIKGVKSMSYDSSLWPTAYIFTIPCFVIVYIYTLCPKSMTPKHFSIKTANLYTDLQILVTKRHLFRLSKNSLVPFKRFSIFFYTLLCAVT